MPSPFPCSPVIRGCSRKKTQIEKKNLILYLNFLVGDADDTQQNLCRTYDLLQFTHMWIKLSHAQKIRMQSVKEKCKLYKSGFLNWLLPSRQLHIQS